MKIDVDLIMRTREETGQGLGNCRKALVLTEGNFDVAKVYLKLISQPFSRKKRTKDGHLMPWSEEDYLKEAYAEIAKMKTEETDNEKERVCRKNTV